MYLYSAINAIATEALKLPIDNCEAVSKYIDYSRLLIMIIAAWLALQHGLDSREYINGGWTELLLRNTTATHRCSLRQPSESSGSRLLRSYPDLDVL